MYAADRAAQERVWGRAGRAAAPLLVAGVGWGLWVATHRGAIDPLLAQDYGSYFEACRRTLARASSAGILGGGIRPAYSAFSAGSSSSSFL